MHGFALALGGAVMAAVLLRCAASSTAGDVASTPAAASASPLRAQATSDPERPAPRPPSASKPELQPGGTATLPRGQSPGLDRFAAGLALRERFGLGVGRSFFRDPWIPAPATTKARDGLGPIFEAHACAACHPSGGAARVFVEVEADGAATSGDAPVKRDAMQGMVVRLSLPGNDPGRRAIPDPIYGDQIQRRGTGLRISTDPKERVVGEGAPAVSWETVTGTYGDGATYELRRPRWRLENPAYGTLDPQTTLAARRAPALLGAGLLDAVTDEELLSRADPYDRDGDGISGRPNRVPALEGAGTSPGRFGWKAGQPTLRQQVASAFREDMGITSALYPEQPCTGAERACTAAPNGADPRAGVEIDWPLLDAVTNFVAALGVPARAEGDQQVRRGAQVFTDSGCPLCHVPQLRTGATARFPALAEQQIRPYSDLLLHDLGAPLSAGQSEFEAGASEWRTAPLWGIGRSARAGIGLLHDGRARTLEEAILWHGGEAETARERFRNAPRDQRDALIAFLRGL